MIKNYLLIALTILVVVCSAFVYFTVKSNKDLKNNWITSENNYKASVNKNRAYQLTINQLKNSVDSVDIEVLEYTKMLNIKDSKIASLMHMIEIGGKADTIILKDTIFVKGLKLDTIVGDKWIRSRIQLNYPSRIIVTDSIYNDKKIVWHYVKETIDPPKKFFVCRWFQPKQTIVEVNIKDLNPYFKTKEFKYTTIIK